MTTMPSGAPPWAAGFYNRKGLASGPSGVLEHHAERAAAIERFGGRRSGRVLELGAGAGGSAVATAQRGHQVVAVELSSVRAGFAKDLARETEVDGLEVVQGDFMHVELSGKFDVITYWNGFGIGSDQAQRALLRRMRQDWLAPDGVVLMDVFNPLAWCREAGTRTVDEETGCQQTNDFDAVEGRMVDRWWFDGDDNPSMAQSQRCYFPADLALLLEGTGLRVLRMEVEGRPLRAVAPGIDGPLGTAWGYRALLEQQTQGESPQPVNAPLLD